MPSFKELFDQELGQLNFPSIEGGYNLKPKVHPSWKEKKRKLLFIVETVDRFDLKYHELLSTQANEDRGYHFWNQQRHIIPSVLDAAWEQVNVYRGNETPKGNPYSIAVANFNAFKTRTLEPSEQIAYNKKFAHRMVSLIDRLKPTHVVFSGATAYTEVIKVIDPSLINKHSPVKRGWVEEIETRNGNKFIYTHTLDLEPLYNPSTNKDEVDEEDGLADKFALADLFYLVSRNIANLLNDKVMYSAREVKIKPVYVDTIKKVDYLFDTILARATDIALDTETKNLESYNNSIYVAQFAVSKDKGFVLPISHPKSPFSESEQAYIKKKLRRLLEDPSEEGRKNFIVMNGKFDLRLTQAQLDIPVVYHHIHELTFAESLLDENVSLLAKGANKVRVGTTHVMTSYQNLANICVQYENDFYYTAKVSKAERGTLGSISPDDPDALLYEAADVQLPFAIYELQQERANNIRYRPSFDSEELVSYGSAFKTNMLYQMSATVHMMSAAERNGSPIDRDYLEYLNQKDSPVRKILAEAKAALEATDAVKKVESRLASNMGRTVGGLFGGKIAQKFFKLSKKDHQQELFFDVLGLEPVNTTKTGQRAIDKAFIAAYEHESPEVKLFGQYVKIFKLISSYVVGWSKKIGETLDSEADGCLRASFGLVTTRRLCSFSPNLQQIPSRGPLAKYLKRAFAAPYGYLSLAYDLSAHEVRMWANQSGDEALADAFRAGQKLRKAWIQNPTEDIAKELATKGDIHIVNIHRFFGVWVNKSDPRRSGIKGVVFGVIYGKSAKSVGNDLKKDRLNGVEAQIRDLKKQIAGLKAEIAKVEQDEEVTA